MKAGSTGKAGAFFYQSCAVTHVERGSWSETCLPLLRLHFPLLHAECKAQTQKYCVCCNMGSSQQYEPDKGSKPSNNYTYGRWWVARQKLKQHTEHASVLLLLSIGVIATCPQENYNVLLRKGRKFFPQENVYVF